MALDCQLDSNGERQKRERTKLISCREHWEVARVRQTQSTGPDSWLVRKLAVFLVVGLFGWTYYVFVVRLAIEMIRQGGNALGGIGEGAALLAIYHVFFVMFAWSYSMAIFTGPGHAKDYVPQSDPPPDEQNMVQVNGYTFQGQQADAQTEKPELGPAKEERETDASKQPSQLQPVANGITDAAHAIKEGFQSMSEKPSRGMTDPANTGGQPVQAPEPAALDPRPSRTSETRSYLNFPPPPEDYDTRPRPPVERIPAQVPVLSPTYRYDAREGILRPYRSHRCRHCGAVILKMDHHCPWVGGCVGARNYKYFYNFLGWSTLYTLYVFVAILATNVAAIPSRPDPDPQQIVVAALAFMFTFFTTALWTAHTRLILLNMTTIEEISYSRTKQRERAALGRTFGFWEFKAKSKVVKRWNEDWGRLGKEGNLWWLGSYRNNWEMVMGKQKLRWFLPVPARPADDGLSYGPNPRFSPEGIWRQRKEWPAELR